MVTLGLTGGIACGKSTVAAELVRRGARLVDADRLAREVVEPGTPGLDAVVAHFGPAVLLPDGQLDRARLGALIFADAAARADLDALLHPRIRTAIYRDLERLRQGGAALALLDAALLFDMGLQAACDAVVTVEADPELQVARLMQRNGLTALAAQQRVAAQWPRERREALADWTIDNRGSLDELAAQVAGLWSALQARFAALAAIADRSSR